MAEPFTVSAHASSKNIDVWASAQDSKTRIASKVGQDGQTVLYAKKMGRFEALFHKTTKEQRMQSARSLVEHALKTDPPAFKPSMTGSGQRLLSLGKFSELPEAFRNSGAFRRQLADLGTALISGDATLMRTRGDELADAISQELRKQPFSEQMRFALGDTNTLARELLSSVIDTAREYLEKSGGDPETLPPDRLDVLGSKAGILLGTVDRIMASLSDCSLSDKEIRVNGHSYIRDNDWLGRGAFGTTYVYRAADKTSLKPGEPETLVVKCPHADPGPKARETNVLGPLREARALVNAAGTGASGFAGNVARFHSVLRGADGTVLVAMRLEEGGAAKGLFEKAIIGLGELDPQKKITEQQYKDLTLTLMKDTIQGALRYREGGQVTHFDLKIDNVLISKDGTGRVADPGASRGLNDADRLDSPTNTDHFTPISYTAPERFFGGKTTPAADVFTLGMTLFEALSKNGPLSLAMNKNSHPLLVGIGRTADNLDVKNRMMEWSRDPNAVMLAPGSVAPGSLLEKYADLINQMTAPSPGKRPTLEQVLAHPLFNEPGIGSTEIRDLIKTLSQPNPPKPSAVPATPAEGVKPSTAPTINVNYGPTGGSTEGVVGSSQSARGLTGGEEMLTEEAPTGSGDALRSVGETRDDAIHTYGRRAQGSAMTGTVESMELPDSSESPAVMSRVNDYVSATIDPSDVRTGSPTLIVPDEQRERSGTVGSRTDADLGATDEVESADTGIRNAYDIKSETKDPVPEGKREIPTGSAANNYM